ncbi:hypothetical protein [Oenococcus phage Vinitor-27]|nr:hypothetical protein [Oenococcus phage Vinitor-27]
MAYLTLEQFNGYGLTTLTSEQFNAIVPFAEQAIDNITNNYYVYNNIADDPITFRVSQFEKAVAFEIFFMNQTGYLTEQDVFSKNQIASQTIGNTSISKSTTGPDQMLVSNDVRKILGSVGLTYRGVRNVPRR